MIILKNTEQFYNHVTGFIDEVAEAVSQYNNTVKRLEPYQGSGGYDQQIKEAQSVRDTTVRNIRETYWPAFQKITANMREAVKNRPIVAPTTEQAALLSVMQMRQTLSRDELERASKQMAGCSMALAVLDDLAEKHKAKGEPFNAEPNTDQLMDKIDSMERAALRLIREGINASNQRKPESVTDCVEEFGSFGRIPKPGAAHYGGVTSADLQPNIAAISAFCKAINQL